MGVTEGRWEANVGFPDLTIFLGADKIQATSGTATLTLNASGDLSLNVGNSQTCVFVASLSGLLRSGVLATSSFDQEQFGTNALQPGPSSVAGTSGPLGLKPGFPPLTAAQLATLGAIQTGAIPKGILINSITPLYSVATVALTAAAIGITATQFANNGSFTVTDLLTKGTNSMSLATTAAIAKPRAVPIALTNPTYVIGSQLGKEVLIEFDLATDTTGTARLYGFSVNCTFNFN